MVMLPNLTKFRVSLAKSIVLKVSHKDKSNEWFEQWMKIGLGWTSEIRFCTPLIWLNIFVAPSKQSSLTFSKLRHTCTNKSFIQENNVAAFALGVLYISIKTSTQWKQILNCSSPDTSVVPSAIIAINGLLQI